MSEGTKQVQGAYQCSAILLTVDLPQSTSWSVCSDTSEAGGKPAQQMPASKPQRVQSVKTTMEAPAQPAAPRMPSTPTLAHGTDCNTIKPEILCHSNLCLDISRQQVSG